MPRLQINEMFYSIQGESTWSGLRCVFIRLKGCHLRCSYCDTEYAFHEGQSFTVDEVLSQAIRHNCDLYEITGGEPLLQKTVHPLMTRLCDLGKTVLIETSGACDISVCDPRVIRIMDIKTPGSGEVDRNLWTNMDHLNTTDEIKFVLCDRADYDWAKKIMVDYDLANRVKAVLMSGVNAMHATKELAGCGALPMIDLAQWIIEDNLPVRMQSQLHKQIWDPSARGV
ncbi:MAG TPA: 7-carboxy-7-deazaguanine synthase [Phycisphaerales bacterium]|nr:7-carboxy-7-deazaguanine synthase [Phycisphaerales bacterium]HCD33690.1 7-carboxy-7-deazaguanine synthase [Phycisphaerales bacterium]